MRKNKKLGAPAPEYRIPEPEPRPEPRPVPRIAEIFGVEVDEVFLIEGYPEFEYKISQSGNMLYRHPDSSEGWGKVWKFSLEPLNHPGMIIRKGLPLLEGPHND